jgi:hypothetical protein
MQIKRNETIFETLADAKNGLKVPAGTVSDGDIIVSRYATGSVLGVVRVDQQTDVQTWTIYEQDSRIQYDDGSSPLPDGYTEVEYIENQSSAYINTGVYLYNSATNSYSISGKVYPTYVSSLGDFQTFVNAEGVTSPYYGMTYRVRSSTGAIQLDQNPSGHATLNSEALGDGTIQFTISTTATNCTNTIPLGLFCSWQNGRLTPYRYFRGKMYRTQVTLNDTLVRDFVPCTRDSDDKVGLYDLVNDVFYPSGNSSYDFVAGPMV